MVDIIIHLLYYSLFLFTPLVMTSVTSELFEFNKMIFIYIITVFIGFFWLLKMIKKQKIIFKRTILDIPILLFLLSQIASTIFSIDPHTSFFGYYGRFNGGLLSIITYIILFYGFVSNFVGTGQILKISLVSSVLVILWGLPGKVGHDLSCLIFAGQFNNSCWTEQFHPETRMFSTLGQPNWLGAYLAINFFIGLSFLWRQLKEKISLKAVLYYGYLFLNFSAILFTRSRSALAATLFGMMLFFVIYHFSRRNKTYPQYFKRNFIILAAIFLISIILFKTGIEKIDNLLSLKFLSSMRNVQKTIVYNPPSVPQSDVTESFNIRKIVWKGAIDLGLKHPLFGTGVETFAYSYYFVRPATHNLTSEWDYLYNKAHNEFLNYLATTGFVGLGTYLLFIAVFIFWSLAKFKSLDIFHLGLFVGWLTILITNFFGFSTTTINLFFYLIPAIATLEEQVVPVEAATGAVKFNRTQWVYMAITLVAALFLFIYFLRYFFADVSFAKSDSFAKSGDYQTSVTYLNQALKLKSEHVYEDKLSYVLANLAVVASYQKQDKLAGQLIDISNFYNQKSLQESPKNVLYWKTKAKNEYLFYQITQGVNELDKGVQALDEAQKLSPTDPKIPYSLAIFYSLLSDEAKSDKEKQDFRKLTFSQVDSAISLKSNFRDAYLLKGQLLKKYGDKEGAKKAWQYILQNLDPNDSEAKKELESL